MKYILPDLDYDFSALEPHISGHIMQLHHDKHHRAYVDGANKAIAQLAEARDARNFASIAGLERALAFNVSGHVLHSLFWKNLSPDGGGEPGGRLADAIERDLGGFDAFKEQMIQAATTTMGSGWAALVFEPVAARVMVTQIHDHQSQQSQGSSPLMVLDAWEHAYYLQYENEKGRYFKTIWNLWDWGDVAVRFDAVSNSDLLIVGANGEARPEPSMDGGGDEGRHAEQTESPTFGLH